MDETFYVIFDVVLIIFGILQIVLFFKIWGMTNNVRRILTIMEDENLEKIQTRKSASTNLVDCKFSSGDLVVDSEGNQWRVVEIAGDVITCRNSTKGVVEFYSGDITLFNS